MPARAGMNAAMATVAAVVDVGSNTVRLLVARSTGAGLVEPHTDRVRLGLGHEIEEHGRISDVKLAATAGAVRTLCAQARAVGTRSPRRGRDRSGTPGGEQW
jgi:exopolyphosphatase/pppGpp-phosphohydrolase